MRKKLKVQQMSLILILLLATQMMKAQQKGMNFDLAGGTALSSSLLSPDTCLFADGLQFGAGLNYMGKKFGVELQGGFVENPLRPDVLQTFAGLPAAATLAFSSNVRQLIHGGLGPVLRLRNDKWGWQLSPKIGWLQERAPILESRAKANNQHAMVFLQTDNGRKWTPYWSLGAKLRRQFSRQLGLYVHADYLSAAGPRDTDLSQLSSHVAGLIDGKGSREVITLAQRIAAQNTNVLNLGAGITYSFGKPAGQEKDRQISCENTQLISPADGAIFLIGGTLRPTFHWQNPTESSVAHYVFRLYRDGTLLYEEQAQKNRFEHQEAVEAIYKRNAAADQLYHWEVETHFNDCEAETSQRYAFRMSNRSGVFHDIFDLECDDPAYTAAGDTRLTGKISFFNNISSSDPLIINDFTDVIIQDALGNPLPGVYLTNITDCVSSLPVPTPLSIPPGGTQTYCFELIIPAGNAAFRSEAHGTINGLPQLSTDQDEVPVCACTICDSWRFSSSLSTLTYVSSGGSAFNALVLEELQIANAAPIREVKAEIVYVEHVANDPQCYTCTKHDNDMGLFSFGTSKPVVLLTNGSWKNSKFGYKGPGHAYDVNQDDFVNQVVWKADDPVNGVDFSSSGHRFRMPLNLPKPSSLDCCDHRYEVCIRYTFTDVNCVSCDYLICYRMTPKGNNGGIGGASKPAESLSPLRKVLVRIPKTGRN